MHSNCPTLFYLFKLTAGRVKLKLLKMKKSLFTALAVGLCMTANLMAQVPSYVPTNGLVGWWPFNGNANDESGNGNNGTVNGATLSSDRFSNPSSSYFFSGISTNITVNNTFFNNGWTGYSISFWFNPNSNQYNGCIINTIPHDGIGIGYSNYGTDKKIYHSKNSNTNVHAWDILNADPLNYASFEFNNWYHVVVIKSSNTYLYYVNGILDKSINSAITPLNEMCKLVFGNMDPSVGFQPVIGSLDDFGIWNRALTQQEITNLYNGCSANGISLQPANVSTSNGTNAQFIVNASSGSIYQWQTDLGLGFQNLSNAGQYSGANNDTLVVANTSVSNNNQQFRCIVNSGSCTDTSDIVVLTISTSGISELVDFSILKIWPNPSNDHITIDAGNLATMNGYSIKIEDAQGQQVFQNAVNQQQFYVDITTWGGNGLYFVRIIDPQGNTVDIKKIVLQ
jgi:hypothetical protein